MGIQVLEGRSFRPGEGADEGRAGTVSASFAQHWWPGEGAQGRRGAVREPGGGVAHTFSLVDGPSVVVITFPLPGLRVP